MQTFEEEKNTKTSFSRISESQKDNISKCMRNIDTKMSEDEMRSITNQDKDCEKTNNHTLQKVEGNKIVGEARICENGWEKRNLEIVKQTSTGNGKEPDTQKIDLDTHVNNSEAHIRSSRRRPTTQSENCNVLRDSDVEEKCCDGVGVTYPEEKYTLPEGETLEDGLQVPDGGWGWLVAMGIFIITMLILSVPSCFSILFSGYLLEMGTSSSTNAWIYNIQWFFWHLVTPLIHPLVKEFGWRRIGYLGVFMASSSVIISAFSPSAEFLFFSYSLLTGFGGGIVLGICFLILPIYFDRRLGLANTFMMTGICMGQIFFPPFIRYLLENYSYKGAALIFGALLMNSFVAVSLFHPVKWHMKKPCQERDPPQEKPVPLKSQKGNSDGPQEQTNPLDAVPKYEGCNEEPNWAATADQAKVMRRQCCMSLRSDISSGILGVIKTLWIILVRVTNRTKSDMGILRSYRALIISFAYTFTVNSFFNFIMLVPFVMGEADHSLQESAWCISVMGISNLVTRLIISPLTDWKRFDMRLCLIFGYAAMGSAVLVFSFVTNLMWITVVLAIFGYGLGSTITLNTLVMIKYLGTENLAATLGVSSLMGGFGFLLVGPTIGFISDKSGSYAISLRVLVAMLYTSSILWLIMPAAVAYDEKKIHKREILQDP